MAHLRWPFAALILILYAGTGLLYARFTPAWQAPDEPAHYNYIRQVATGGSLPVLRPGCYDEAYLRELTSRRFPPELSVEPLCYEAHQPPLYYLLAAPLFQLSAGSLLALRLLSVLLGAGVLLFALLIGQTLFPDRPLIGLGALAFAAFVPMHVAILASVNNDALAGLIFAAVLFLLVRRLRAPARPTWRGDLLLGLALGLALLTKLTIYMALPLAAVTLGLEARQAGRGWPLFLKKGGLVFGLALLLALPWYLRNLSVYGFPDFLGMIQHDAVVEGQLRTRFYVADLGLLAYLSNLVTVTFRSFWGQFGWMAVPMDGRTYQLLAVLSLVALAGLIGFWILDFGFWWRIFRRYALWWLPIDLDEDESGPLPESALLPGQRQALLLLVLTVGFTLAAYGWYNLTFVQFQGRYLFPALVPLGLFFTLGLVEAFGPRWRWWLVGGLAVALVWVAAASLLSGGFDTRGVLIVGLLLLLFSVRAQFAPTSPRAWPVALCFAGLALLTLLSPFWFVIPNL